MSDIQELSKELNIFSNSLNNWAKLQKSMNSQNSEGQLPLKRDLQGRIPIKTWRQMVDSNPDFAGMSEEEWADLILQHDSGVLQKSFVTGEPGDINSLSALVRENLDPLMVDVQLKESHLTLLNSIERVCTPSRISQRVRFQQRGAGPGRGYMGFGEGQTPRHGGGDRFDRMMYSLVQQGVVGSTTDWAAATGNYMTENPVMLEHRNRMLEFLTNLNHSLFFGDKRVNVGPAGNQYEFDGFLRLMETLMPNHIFDLQGEAISIDIFAEVANILAEDALIDDLTGRVNCVLPHRVATSLAMDLTQRTRHNIDADIGKNIIPGSTISGVNTNIGYIPFHPTITLQGVYHNRPVRTTEVVDKAPVLPNMSGLWSVTQIAYVNTTSKINTSTTISEAGDYKYWISASNTYGESLPSAPITETMTSAEGDQAFLISINAIPGIPGILSWKIYRSTKENATIDDAEWIATVPYGTRDILDTSSDYTTNSTTYVDHNQVIPGTDFIIIKSIDPNDVNIGQLIPVVKRPWSHPDFATSNLFIMFSIMCLRVWKPESVIILKNVGIPADNQLLDYQSEDSLLRTGYL